jgi:hypothetical protein
MEEYFILVRIKIKENVMKTSYFENVRNREKFFCKNLKDIQKIDGVDYLRVFRMETQRECLVKLDSLRKIPQTK